MLQISRDVFSFSHCQLKKRHHFSRDTSALCLCCSSFSHIEDQMFP